MTTRIGLSIEAYLAGECAAWAAEDPQPSDASVGSERPPNLAIEARSPCTWHLDRGRKRDVYETAGVAELWLVDAPEHVVRLFGRSKAGARRSDVSENVGSGGTVTAPMLAGFGQPIDEQFAD
ncbi:MAG TPA: Uma2 family endonuclease [Acidimicrobiales bacterium]|jgi:Uma2 family endonuclease